MQTKTCTKCENKKEITEFNKNINGIESRCKSCKADYDKKHYLLNRQKYLSASRKNYYENRDRCLIEQKRYYNKNRERILSSTTPYKYLSDEEKLRRFHSNLEWRKRNHEKHKAHWTVQNGIKTGKLTKDTCFVCDCKKDIHAHHDNYDFPLEITWLCRSCHNMWHDLLKGCYERERIRSTPQYTEQRE